MQKTFVTQPTLPSKDEFDFYIKKIWESKTLTNCGSIHNELERELENFLKVDHVSLYNNGTIALMAAIKSLNLTGEVITTPYTFLATSHSIIWNNLTPVFVDIEENDFNIDPQKIEAAITDKTSAILPVQCYGRPCNQEKINEIAQKHNLKVIYDSAHSFNVEDSNGSILHHGDASIISFHATKSFNTFEGGAVITNSENHKSLVDSIRNFGMQNHGKDVGCEYIGLNGKLSEIHSAMGLLQLKEFNTQIEKRKNVDALYRTGLKDVTGINIPSIDHIRKYNYSYFPITVSKSFCMTRDELVVSLNEKGIFPRKYFYPLVSSFKAYEGKVRIHGELENAKMAAERILCLPIYPELDDIKVEEIIDYIKKASK
jgi:dTDP-4-amino-4,6-dideoxygalactose transaminase